MKGKGKENESSDALFQISGSGNPLRKIVNKKSQILEFQGLVSYMWVSYMWGGLYLAA